MSFSAESVYSSDRLTINTIFDDVLDDQILVIKDSSKYSDRHLPKKAIREIGSRLLANTIMQIKRGLRGEQIANGAIYAPNYHALKESIKLTPGCVALIDVVKVSDQNRPYDLGSYKMLNEKILPYRGTQENDFNLSPIELMSSSFNRLKSYYPNLVWTPGETVTCRLENANSSFCNRASSFLINLPSRNGLSTMISAPATSENGELDYIPLHSSGLPLCRPFKLGNTSTNQLSTNIPNPVLERVVSLELFRPTSDKEFTTKSEFINRQKLFKFISSLSGGYIRFEID